MKNAYILLALFLFSYLQTAFDTGELRHTNSNSKTTIRQSINLAKEFLGCDFYCMSLDDDASIDDPSSIVLEVLELVCSRIGCAIAPEVSPSIPAHQEPVPAIFKEGTPQFEAPGMLNGLIIET